MVILFKNLSLVFFASLLFLPHLFAETELMKSEPFERCNWLVSFRGRTYDLAPISREALARPIESDLRHIIKRVPAANEHLESMASNLQSARAHTMLASIFISGFVISKILQSREKNSNNAEVYQMAMGASGLFFLKALDEVYWSTRKSKEELALAVDAFNVESPNKILPANPQVPLGGNDAEKK